jgi:hypothetical protein
MVRQQTTAVEFFSHPGQALGAGVEDLCQSREQRRLLFKLKQIELRDDVVATGRIQETFR